MANDRNDNRWGDEPTGPGDRYGSGDRDSPDSRDLEVARQKVKGPAIALMVMSVITMLALAAGIFQYFFTMDDQFAQQRRQIDADPNMPAQGKKDMNEFMDSYQKVVNVALPLDWPLLGITSVVIFVGALKMKNLSSRGWARTSAILAMIPCLSGCCILGIPFGIWALMVLGNEDVKRGFACSAPKSNRDDDLR